MKNPICSALGRPDIPDDTRVIITLDGRDWLSGRTEQPERYFSEGFYRLGRRGETGPCIAAIHAQTEQQALACLAAAMGNKKKSVSEVKRRCAVYVSVPKPLARSRMFENG